MNRRGAMALLSRVAVAALLIAHLVVGRAARADWSTVEERFYALSLADKPCGRSIEKVERDGDRLRTTARIELRFTRLGEETSIDLESVVIEKESGAAIEALSCGQLGVLPAASPSRGARSPRSRRSRP